MIHPPQVRTRPARPLWMRIAPIFVGATLIAAVLFGAYSLINHLTPSPTHISAFTPTPGHSLTQPASSPTSDPTAAPTSDPQALFNNTTKKPASPNYALISTDPPSKKDWPQTSGTCDLMNDGYHITASTPGQYTSCMLQNGTYNDFAFQVQMQISPSGDAGGMIFRSNSQMSMFYRFSIDAQGSYVLLVCTQCASNANINAQQLKGGTLPKASNQYTLTVIASKNTIYLYINGQFIVQVTDSTSSSGAIGLYAASINQATTVIFTKAKVWKL